MTVIYMFFVILVLWLSWKHHNFHVAMNSRENALFSWVHNLHENKICHLARQIFGEGGALHVFSGGSYIHTKMYFHESCNRHTWKIFVAKISWHLALTKIIFETWHILWRSPQWIIPATKMVRDGLLSRKCCFREARFMRGLSWELVVMDYFCVGFGYFRDCFRLPRNLHFLVVWSIYFPTCITPWSSVSLPNELFLKRI